MANQHNLLTFGKYTFSDPSLPNFKRHAPDWFADDNTGAHVIFDGQYGSTGKGLLAQVLAHAFRDSIDGVTTSAGPNSGHTCYLVDYDNRSADVRCVLHQLPTAGVVLRRMGYPVQIFLNAGAVINFKTLREEIVQYVGLLDPICIHPNAAVVDQHIKEESEVGGTNQGVGLAIANKITRANNPDAKIQVMADIGNPPRYHLHTPDIHTGNWLVETAQGWSLGINQPFYPFVTSRECGVAQALSDFGIAPKALRKSIVSLRTLPIRVAGKSGGWYPDQRELTWAELGQQPELTSTTKKERRIATWSRKQYVDMLKANEPDAVFINFLNYIREDTIGNFISDCILRPYHEVMGRKPDFVLAGLGKYAHDVKLLEGRG